MAIAPLITITGQLQMPVGTGDATARVVMEQQVYLVHTDGTAVEPQVYIGVCDADGNVSMDVPPTDHPDWRPQHWAYRVTFDGIENPQWSKPFRAEVPYNSGDLTLNDLIPVGSPSAGALYAPINHTHSGLTFDWSQITGKPSTFPPSAHTHPASQISDFDAALAKSIEIKDRRGSSPNGEWVIPRRFAQGRMALDSDILYVTHFRATQTRTISSVLTTCDIAATSTSHAWLGFLRWQAGVGYTPLAVSVDDPSRWSSATTYDTSVFGVTGGGSANLSDPGFDMVEDLDYAFTVQWVGSGTKPQLRACPVNPADAFIEPRQNGYMGLSAPPSGQLMPEWLVGSNAQFQGYMKY